MNYLVIKCGGSVLAELPDSFYQSLVHLQKNGEWRPVVVHGGGPLISSSLKKLGISTQFVDGLRVTTDEVLNVVEMVLSGSVNKQIVRHIISAGGQALGLSGIDGSLLNTTPSPAADRLGFVGEVQEVNDKLIDQVSEQGYIPVISPLGIDENGQRYNINGDMAASAVAKALEAKLCLISNIPGIYIQRGEQKEVLQEITKDETEQLIADEVIVGGMIPKVRAAMDALAHRVPEVVILDGTDPNSLLDFCAGAPIGTKLILDEEARHVQYHV